jgi:hypothetical protein
MKRFLLFAFDSCYPSGGLSDVIKEFDTSEEALDWAKTNKIGYDYAILFDCVDRKVIWDKDDYSDNREILA